MPFRYIYFIVIAGDCAEACRGTSEMFGFGTNNYVVESDTAVCGDNKCRCICFHDTDSSRCNKQIENIGYNLYTFEGKLLLFFVDFKSHRITENEYSERSIIFSAFSVSGKKFFLLRFR